MTEHSPGPWTVEETWSGLVIRDANYVPDRLRNGRIATVANRWDERWQNAFLIAAAPDLLAACEASAEIFAERAGCSRVPHSGAHLLPVIEAAIAKAKGQS